MKVIIAGGGIGGLSAALALHAAGVEAEVFERAAEFREIGVGINMLPHAVKELAALGLLPALDQAIRAVAEVFGEYHAERLEEDGFDDFKVAFKREQVAHTLARRVAKRRRASAAT